MKAIHQHDCAPECGCCTFLGTVDNQDLYFSGQGNFGSTLIARYSSDGPDYMSGLCFSKDGILRIAAERAIEKGLLTREQWRRFVYQGSRGYVPYSEVKALMLMSTEDMWTAMQNNKLFDRHKNSLIMLDIIARREEP